MLPAVGGNRGSHMSVGISYKHAYDNFLSKQLAAKHILLRQNAINDLSVFAQQAFLQSLFSGKLELA